MRKFHLAGVLCFFLVCQSVKGQYYFFNDKYYDNDVVIELGGSFGIMNAFTDLGGKKGIGKNFIKDLNWKNSKPGFGLHVIATYRSVIGLRLQGTFGQVVSYDSILKDVKETTFGRYERNLSFKSRITDIQLGIEVHPLFFKNYYNRDEEPPFLSPYIVAGVGYFSFDPQANLNGQWYSLQPLSTEGQGFAEYPDRKPYKLNQLNLAAGLGVKYEVTSLINARLEVNHRFLMTDYLDDVSEDSYIDPALFNNYLSAGRAAIAQQLFDRRAEVDPGHITNPAYHRGDPKDKDAFFTIELKVGVTLGRQRR
ncbi:MAG TPA: hypothetical protein PKG90_08805 [Chitinophagaceae bacterium]|nr:hypothetical protein [Chitinophagaceae bacterium]HNU13015.1 hypothetical protein [Chitinophagaceae bacterium]